MGIIEDLNNREIHFPNPDTFRDPYSTSSRTSVAGRTWVITHSTRPCRQGKRNANIMIPKELRESAQYTYQDPGSDKTHNVVLAEGRWGVMGQGKVGKLANWMQETPYGIADESGEVRGDWRATWAILIINDAQGVYEGMDLLANTFCNSNGIAEAVNIVCRQEYCTVAFRPEDLYEVDSNGGRARKVNEEQKVREDRERKARQEQKVQEASEE